MSDITVYSGQIFIKKVSLDKSIDIHKKGELEELKVLITVTLNAMKEQVDYVGQPNESTLRLYTMLNNRIKELQKNTFDKDGQYQFWFLNNIRKPNEPVLDNNVDELVLLSIKGNKSCSFNSIDDLFKEFIPLDTFLKEGQFVGRELNLNSSKHVYVMYCYENRFITCNLKRDGKVLITIGSGDFEKIDDIVSGPINESFRDPKKMYSYIYKMKRDYTRQID